MSIKDGFDKEIINSVSLFSEVINLREREIKDLLVEKKVELIEANKKLRLIEVEKKDPALSWDVGVLLFSMNVGKITSFKYYDKGWNVQQHEYTSFDRERVVKYVILEKYKNLLPPEVVKGKYQPEEDAFSSWGIEWQEKKEPEILVREDTAYWENSVKDGDIFDAEVFAGKTTVAWGRTPMDVTILRISVPSVSTEERCWVDPFGREQKEELSVKNTTTPLELRDHLTGKYSLGRCKVRAVKPASGKYRGQVFFKVV